MDTYRPLYLTVNGNELSFTVEDNEDTGVRVTDFRLDSPLFVMSPFIFSADFYSDYDKALKVKRGAH